MAYVLPEPPMAGPALHEPAASAAPRTERTRTGASGAGDRRIPDGNR